MKKLIIPFAFLLVLTACHREARPDGPVTAITVGAKPTKTSLGAESAGSRPVYWSDGDKLALNGSASDALSGVAPQTTQATFAFHGSFTAPYNLLYPASYWKDATHVTLPATQAWAADNGVAVPLAGIVTAIDGTSTLDLEHLAAVLHLRIKKSASVSAANLTSVTFKGNNGEQVCGDFEIDYTSASLTPAGTGEEVELTLDQALSESQELDIFLSVPAQNYSKGFSVVLEDAQSRTMTISTGSSAISFPKGKVLRSRVTDFVPGDNGSFTLEDVEIGSLAPDGCNVTGRVLSSAGEGLGGVVVSDGLQCVRTTADGRFYLTSDLSKTRFVWVSTPSGYTAPAPDGIPQYYKRLASGTLSAGVYDMGDYTLEPVDNPDRFTLLISADPQPRKYAGWNNDRIAYKSLDICEDYYAELTEVAAGISGRKVYGICLGDLVHEDMELMATYASKLGGLGYPTYNVIGNHDHDPAAADDAAGAIPFENLFGPVNYSFNIGGIHFVVLDNMIMAKDGDNKLTIDPNHDKGGLTDEVWAWLQADLALVPTSAKLMVCSHAPMFKAITGADRTGGTHPVQHGADYGALIGRFPEVHAWAGHTHVGFNYNYPSNHRNKRVQVHTLARSTGELWTNEYLASGTPRGFTVVEVDGGNISWKFHPTRRQTASFVGVTSGICSAGAPAYAWRDWNYSGGLAVMKNGGGPLTEDYQLRAYPRGSYGDGYVYANVFLWDDKWSNPVWTPTGGTPVEMDRLTESSFDLPASPTDEQLHAYDLATKEFKSHYKPNVGFFKTDDGYSADELGQIVTLFRAPADATPASGTVSVTDRFGTVYTYPVSW